MQVKHVLNPLQFAFQPLVGVDDTAVYLLQHGHSHQDGTGDMQVSCFFLYSCAFIQLLLLSEKLLKMGVTSYVLFTFYTSDL